jgi:hypothetical protein
VDNQDGLGIILSAGCSSHRPQNHWLECQGD